MVLVGHVVLKDYLIKGSCEFKLLLLLLLLLFLSLYFLLTFSQLLIM